MKNKSHDITKGELSAESQERRLQSYDPAKQPCKQGNLLSSAGVSAGYWEQHAEGARYRAKG